MADMSPAFLEGLFYAICQRVPTNRELIPIMSQAKTMRDALRMIRSLPEGAVFYNRFHGLSCNWIDHRLCVGERPSPLQAECLVLTGINLIVNLTEQDYPYRDFLRDSGVTCAHAPIRNNCYNDPSSFAAAARIILAAVRSGQRVYGHCYSGVSRSAVVAAIVVGAQHGVGYSAASEIVKSKRPLASPHPDLLTRQEAEDVIRSLSKEFLGGQNK